MNSEYIKIKYIFLAYSKLKLCDEIHQHAGGYVEAAQKLKIMDICQVQLNEIWIQNTAAKFLKFGKKVEIHNKLFENMMSWKKSIKEERDKQYTFLSYYSKMDL